MTASALNAEWNEWTLTRRKGKNEGDSISRERQKGVLRFGRYGTFGVQPGKI